MTKNELREIATTTRAHERYIDLADWHQLSHEYISNLLDHVREQDELIDGLVAKLSDMLDSAAD